MRLIDADVMINNLTAMKSQYDAIDLDGMIRGLKEQSTAYDVEKVVKQLLDMRLIRVEQCHGDYEIEVMTESNFDDAIDIVKRSGVE